MARIIRKKSSIAQVLETTQGKTYTVLAVTFVAIVLMITVAIQPAYMSITNKLSENEARRVYLEQIKLAKANLDSISQNQETRLSKEITLMNSLIADKNNDEFISANIAGLAIKSQVELSSISFDRETNQNTGGVIETIPGAIPVQINISVTGTKAELEKFIESIETFPATISITDLSYNVVEEEDKQDFFIGEQEFTMSIAGTYFHFLNQE